MEAKHTPGPWHTRKPEESNGYVWINPIDGCCGEIATAWPLTTDAEAEANARLMAAAPELLEALQEIADSDRYEITCLKDDKPRYAHGKYAEIALHAIAKATGA